MWFEVMDGIHMAPLAEIFTINKSYIHLHKKAGNFLISF
jgi:hypothetical protein